MTPQNTKQSMTMQKYYFDFYRLSFSCVYLLFVCVIKGHTHPECDSSVFLFWSFLCLFLLVCVSCRARFVSTLWISRGNLLLRKVNNIKNCNTQINKYQAHLSEKNMKLPSQFKTHLKHKKISHQLIIWRKQHSETGAPEGLSFLETV